MSDLIKRVDAIRAIHREARIAGGSVAIEYADMFQDAIEALPSADRPQGEWIVDEEQGTSTCSNCGIMWQFTDGTSGSKFCPNCGAMMKTAENERDYERAIEQMQYDMLYEPTYNPEDGSM